MSLSRFHTIGNKRSKSQGDITTHLERFNCSTAVTNRVVLYVNNFVSKYPRNLLHMSLNLPSNISASVVHNIVRNSHKAFVEHQPTFHIGIIQPTIHSAQIQSKIAENLWCILMQFYPFHMVNFL